MNFLKKILLSVLCLQIALPNGQLKDILLIPVLINHYFENNHHERHTHFTDFITQHYSDSDQHPEEHNDHENLPFHHHHDCSSHQEITEAVCPQPAVILYKYNTVSVSKKMIERQHFYASSSLSSIWRPPKLS